MAINVDGDSNDALDIGYGGTGSQLTDPGADRILFWDDSAAAGSNTTWLTPGTGLSITATTLNVTWPITFTSDYSSDFDAAVVAIGATPTTLYVDDATTMSTNVTTPVTLAVIVLKGGSIDQDGNTLTTNGPLIIQGGTIDNDAACTINGSFQAGNEQVFTNTTVPTLAGEVGRVNVLWFGADNTGTAASDSAIEYAVQSAVTTGEWGQQSVYFPTGLYKITTSALLSNTAATGKKGIHFVGDGWASSRLYLSPTAADLWFYDTYGDTTERSQFDTFTDLAFFGNSDPSGKAYADVSDYCKGFRVYGTSYEQGLKFTRCHFSMLHTGFTFLGTNLASEIKFNQCRIEKMKDVMYYINNLGSLNHEFFSTDVETIWGDFIRVGTSGGGSVKVYGGSWIALTGATYSNADEYVLDIPAAAATGTNSGIFTFNGVRFEHLGNDAMLVRHAGGSIHAIFRDCIFWSTATAVKTDWVKILQHAVVSFDACTFSWNDTDYYENYSIDTASQYGSPGMIRWFNCLVHDDLSEHIDFTSNYGRASATWCRGMTGGAIATEPRMFALNFDMFGPSAAYGDLVGGNVDNNIPLKTVSIMFSGTFPYNNTEEKTVKLPKGALIKAIRLQKLAAGTSGHDYCLHVGNDDKTTIYVSSIPEDEKYTHRINYERGATSIAQLTTRTDANTGVFTFWGENHSISDGDTVNVNWVESGTVGRRMGMTITSIVMTTQGAIIAKLDGGAGDDLPTANVDCHLSSVAGFIDVGATDNERIVRLWSSDGDKTTASGAGGNYGGYAIVEYY